MYDAILHLWVVMLLFAVVHPIIRLMGVYIRRNRLDRARSDDVMNPIPTNPGRNSPDKAQTTAGIVFALAYLFVVVGVYSWQKHFIVRLVAANLAACCSAPAVYVPIGHVIASLLYMSKTMFVMALVGPLSELMSIGLRYLLAKRKSAVQDS